MFSDRLSVSLQKLCETRRLSPETAAQYCQLSFPRFCKLVHQESPPTMTDLEHICQAFDISPNELLGYPYLDDLRFRKSSAVISAHLARSSGLIVVYPVCPQCRLPISREFQGFCSSCGQALSWDTFCPDDDAE